MTSNNKEMSARLQESEQKHSEAKKWITALKNENQELKGLLDCVNSDGKESVISDMRDAMKIKQNEIYNYQVLVNKLQKEIKIASTGFVKMEMQKLELKEKHKDELNRTVMGMMESNKKLKEQLAKSQIEKQTIADVEGEVCELLKEMKKKDEIIDNLNARISELETNSYKVIDGSDGAEKDVEQNKTFLEKIKLLDQTVEDKNQIIANLTQSYSELKQNYTNLEQLHQEEKLKQTSSNSIDSDILVSYRNQVKSLEEENHALRLSRSSFDSMHEMTSMFSITSLDDMKKVQEDAIQSLRAMQTRMETQLKSIEEARNKASTMIVPDASSSGVQNNLEDQHPCPATENYSVQTSVKDSQDKEQLQQYQLEHPNDTVVENNTVNTPTKHQINESMEQESGFELTLSSSNSNESCVTEFTVSPVSRTNWADDDSFQQVKSQPIPKKQEERFKLDVLQPNRPMNTNLAKENAMPQKTLYPNKNHIGEHDKENSRLDFNNMKKSENNTDGFKMSLFGQRSNGLNTSYNHHDSENVYGNKHINNPHQKEIQCENNKKQRNIHFKPKSSRNPFSSINTSNKSEKLKKSIGVIFKKPIKDTPSLFALSDADVDFQKTEWETF